MIFLKIFYFKIYEKHKYNCLFGLFLWALKQSFIFVYLLKYVFK